MTTAYKIYIVAGLIPITTGGVPLLTPVDFVNDYLKQVSGFIGIIASDQMNVDAETTLENALDSIQQRYETLASAE